MTAFESLAKDRRDYVDAARRNGFEEGLRKLLADLYPDNAHFIYELLQNAEDAGASEVSFDLRLGGLRVEHDGTRPFDLKDIDSITGFGQSTKIDDLTSIGKFGVGFKAVFAYTQTPVIHSGEHSFAIEDLFVPTATESDIKPGLTAFWFPFDRPEKPADRAVAEVERALHDLSNSTLLFLSNIRTITTYFPNGAERMLGRRDVTERIIAIETIDEQSEPSYWYRITGNARVAEKEYPVAAAFALERKHAPDAGRPPNPGPGGRPRTVPTPEFTVQPVEGQVFIYFPAVKETSGLKFHIHAPFASTVARDSVREEESNETLVASIAGLVAESIPAMRDAGLVTYELLGALPHTADPLPVRYEVIREQLLAAFQTLPVTPMIGGEHAASRTLVRSASALRAVLAPADVDVLRDISVGIGENRAVGWLPERDGRARQFIDSLQAIDFGANELAEVFDRLGGILNEVEDAGDEADDIVDEVDRADLHAWYDWISAKEDVWLKSFYVALGRLTQQSNNPYKRADYRYNSWIDPLPDSLASAPIVRIHAGSTVAHTIGSRAYLPTAPGLRMDGLVLDSLVAFEDGQIQSEKQDVGALRQFYSNVEVRDWDAATQLDTRFASYVPGETFDLNEHFDDLRTLAQLLQEHLVTPSDYSDRAIILASDGGDNLHWTAPSSIYLDDPYTATGLRALYESEAFTGRGWGRRLALAEVYRPSEVDIVSLVRKLGALDTIQITRSNPRHGNPEFRYEWTDHENYNRVEIDWTIEHFAAIVATQDETLLRTLWQVVTTAPGDRADAHYQANRSRRNHAMKSVLLQKLSNVPWVLDRYGNLNRPEDVTPAELDGALHVPDSAPLLDRTGFGRKAATDEQEKADADQTAQKYGFDSADDLARVGALRQKDPEKFRELLDRAEAEDQLPEGSATAPAQRAKRASEAAKASPSRRYEERIRSIYVQVPGHLSTARAYLRELYTNAEGVMFCQICSQAMPFKVGSEYYFEAVQFVKDSERDLQENRLALCPTCAARYRHARSTPLSDLWDDLLTLDIGSRGSIHIDVVLAGEDRTIRFVGKHALDLQAALETTEGSLPADLDYLEDIGDTFGEPSMS